MIERLGEAIKKYQALVELQPESDIKRKMIAELEQMKMQYAEILNKKMICPPYLEETIGKLLEIIEVAYNKKVCN